MRALLKVAEHSPPGLPADEQDDPMVGIAGRPWYPLDDRCWDFDGLHDEVCRGLANADPEPAYAMCARRPEDGTRLDTQAYAELTGADKAYADSLHPSRRSRWLALRFGAASLLGSVVMLKRRVTDVLEPAAALFPAAVDWALGCGVFEHVDMMSIFMYDAHVPVPMHRDWRQEPHRKHVMLATFGPPRRSYVFDPLTGTKHHVAARIYTFNVRDYHGAEPEPRARYVLRVDGLFTEAVRDEIGIPDGFVTPAGYTPWSTPSTGSTS